jgi:hypothetical protein
MRKYCINEIRKTILNTWPKLSEYLGTNLSWNEFLKECKGKFRNFQGFKLLKSKYPPCWYAGFRQEKGKSYVYMAYWPEVKGDLEWHVCHELVHLFRGTVHRNKFHSLTLVTHILEEALCDVVATKATGKRERELKTKGLYNLIEVCALEQIIYELKDNQIRKLVFMPKTVEEAKTLTYLVIKWLKSEKFRKNMEKVWKWKIKERVYYSEIG